MPIFEYHCSNCDEDFEKLVLSSSAKIQCPRCNKTKVTKKMSAFSFKTGSKASVPSSSSSQSGGCCSCAGHHCSTCH
ncbi:MAG TPA: zinc ribbon domain-containing protein [Thermodesulfobacteriota bacterium]|nr:zinc ribbon domain-containing protein [Thermodesulfobacteriota bacterium]